jgi:hypothetical protein
MAITKEIELHKITTAFFEDEETGDRFPFLHAWGEIVVKDETGTKMSAGTTRIGGAIAPDQDAGDHPDAPDPTSRGQKIAVPQSVKDQLRAAQNAHVTPELADKYRQFRERQDQAMESAGQLESQGA